MPYHLAQVNIARMRGSPGELVMADMFSRMDEMNRLAEQSAGFVWRWHVSEASPDALDVFEDLFVAFEPKRLFYNMSVWKASDIYASTHSRRHTQKCCEISSTGLKI
jgi:uncharacterized protein DUF3291